jgi:hypothetical protein
MGVIFRSDKETLVTNPYTTLPLRAFWRAAVAERSFREIDELWDPKFVIGKTDPIATLGSCFAQHIGRALVAEGYNWLNCEPAPPKLTAASKARFQYEVFSVRTANIYTVALLRQWVRWALEDAPVPDEIWRKDNGIYDPFRPTIEPGGFASEEEMLALRRQTIRSLRSMFNSCRIFIFTLGLTEAWINSAKGYVYPMCPGTSAGEFDARMHQFRNCDFFEIYSDLTDVLRTLRAHNSDIKVLLTVSPVPLTATASGDHVLNATIRSKSILRAVASTAVSEHDFVDYFPSYEMISSFPFAGEFYESNLRSVSAIGVALVMKTFFRELARRDGGSLAKPESSVMPDSSASGGTLGAERGRDEVDLICEEMMLDEYER